MIEAKAVECAKLAFFMKLRDLDGMFGENYPIIDCQKADIDLALDELFKELNKHER